MHRTRTIFKQLELKDYTQTNVQILGSEQSYGPHARDVNPREAVIWIAAQHSQKKAMEIFAREVAPAGTGMGMLPSCLSCSLCAVSIHDI